MALSAIQVTLGSARIQNVSVTSWGDKSTPAINVTNGPADVHLENVRCTIGGGIYSTAGDDSTIVNCEVISPEGAGITVFGATGPVSVIGNRVEGAATDADSTTGAFVLDGDGSGDDAEIVFVGNVGSSTFGPGLFADDLYGLVATNNRLRGSAHGVELVSLRSSQFSDNVIDGSPGFDGPYLSWHGIRISDCSDTTVANNRVIEPGQETSNTYDGINVLGNSDRNTFVSNTIQPGTAVVVRYGINIGTATCNDNVVVGNNFGGSALYATGPFNNAGTSTVTTYTGGAVGDNVTY